jgi:chromosome segregation ATPase
MSAFASVADPDLVRVDGARVLGSEGRMADAEQLDRAAMSLLLKEREAILASTRDDLAATEQRLSETEQRLSETERRLAETRDRLAASEREASETEQQLGSRLAEGEAALAQRSITLAQTERALDAATTEVDAVHRTLSWRLTRPLRALRAKRSGRDLAPEEVSSEPLGPSASDELRVETGDHKAGQPAT